MVILDAPVLVVSLDQTIRALLEQMLAAEGLRAAVAWADERVEDAVRRLAPSLVLLDCDHELAGSDLFVQRVHASGSGILLFSPSRDADHVRDCASVQGLPWFTLPIDRQALGRLVTHTRREADRGHEERREA